MEIIISFTEDGSFAIEKTEGMAIFTAVGMLELAKKLILEDGNKEEETVEEEVDTNEIMQ